jgi:hypothetical protein
MEIHKPKPWHGAREFLKEYAIIVVGVLTALGAEQAVEWAHWRHEVAEAREALLDEIRTNSAIGMIGAEESRCLLEWLQDYVDWTKGGPRPQLSASGTGVRFMGPSSTVWDATQAGQTVAHMPLKERLAFAHFYAGVANQAVVIQSVRAMATQLGRYTEKSDLTPDEARRLGEDVSAARIWFQVRGGNDAALVQAAKALGVAPKPLSEANRRRLEPICGPDGVR